MAPPILINEEPKLAFVPTNHSWYEYPVEVKPTVEMGNGVFATRDINKGELCCYYDGIVVPSDIGFDNLISSKFGYGHDYTTDSTITMVNDEEVRIQNTNSGSALAGFTRPLRRGGVGQIINDWSMSAKTYDYDYLKNINIYAISEEVGVNTGDYVLLMMAKKDIKRGSQLFYQYGEGYWAGYKIANSPFGVKHKENFEGFVKDARLHRNATAKLIRKYTDGDTLKDYINRYKLCIDTLKKKGSRWHGFIIFYFFLPLFHN